MRTLKNRRTCAGATTPYDLLGAGGFSGLADGRSAPTPFGPMNAGFLVHRQDSICSLSRMWGGTSWEDVWSRSAGLDLLLVADVGRDKLGEDVGRGHKLGGCGDGHDLGKDTGS